MNIFECAAALIEDNILDESEKLDMLKSMIQAQLKVLNSLCGYSPNISDELMNSTSEYQLSAINGFFTDAKNLAKMYVDGGNKFNSAKVKTFLASINTSSVKSLRPWEVAYFNNAFDNITSARLTTSVTAADVLKPTENLFTKNMFTTLGTEIWSQAGDGKIMDMLQARANLKTMSTKAYKRKEKSEQVKAFKDECEKRNEEILAATDGRFKFVKGNGGNAKPMLLDLKQKLQLTLSNEKQRGEGIYEKSLNDVFANGTTEELVSWIKSLFKISYGDFFTNRSTLTPDIRFTHKGDAIVAAVPEMFRETGYVGGLSGTKQINGAESDEDDSDIVYKNCVLHFINLSEGTAINGARYGHSKAQAMKHGEPYYNEYNPADDEILIISPDSALNKSYTKDNIIHIFFEIDATAVGENDKESASNYSLLGVYSNAAVQPTEDRQGECAYYTTPDGMTDNHVLQIKSVSSAVQEAVKLLKSYGYIVG